MLFLRLFSVSLLTCLALILLSSVPRSEAANRVGRAARREPAGDGWRAARREPAGEGIHRRAHAAPLASRFLHIHSAQEGKAAAALPAPRRVELRSDKLLLGKALETIRQQTGITVADARGEPDLAIAVNLQQATFWQAVDAVAAASKSKVVVSPRDGAVSLVRAAADDRVPPTSYDGDFRVRVLRITSNRDLDSTRSSCTLSLEVGWVPTLRPLFLESQVQQLRVLDEKGKVVPVVEEGSSLAPVDGRYSFTIDLGLPGFPRSDAHIGAVEGKLTAVAPSKMLSFRFDADLKALQDALPGGALRRLTQEDVVCRLAGIKLDRGRWSLSIGLEYPEGGLRLESYQGASLVINNEPTLVSKDGKRSLSPTGYVVESVTSRRALVTYHFTDRPGTAHGRPEAWRVQYRAPARIVTIPFRFRFKNLLLP